MVTDLLNLGDFQNLLFKPVLPHHSDGGGLGGVGERVDHFDRNCFGDWN